MNDECRSNQSSPQSSYRNSQKSLKDKSTPNNQNSDLSDGEAEDLEVDEDDVGDFVNDKEKQNHSQAFSNAEDLMDVEMHDSSLQKSPSKPSNKVELMLEFM